MNGRGRDHHCRGVEEMVTAQVAGKRNKLRREHLRLRKIKCRVLTDIHMAEGKPAAGEEGRGGRYKLEENLRRDIGYPPTWQYKVANSPKYIIKKIYENYLQKHSRRVTE